MGTCVFVTERQQLCQPGANRDQPRVLRHVLVTAAEAAWSPTFEPSIWIV